MPEQTPRSLNHFAYFRFLSAAYQLDRDERRRFHTGWLAALRQSAAQVEIYQAYPAQSAADILVWSALPAGQPEAAAQFFSAFARATNPYRSLLEPVEILWGYTRPSQYTRTRSTQEIDPFSGPRKPYLVLYPFVKTAEWYRMSREARQGMMNEHIRIGKEYPHILQLLLYSFGLQDQEFIVTYEMDDLVQFSDLVYDLRGSEARRFTERDTPLRAGLYHTPEETLSLWE